MAIAVLPIIFANYGHRQIFFMTVVLVCYGFVQAWLLPWRTGLPNVLDALMTGSLILILCGGGMLVGTDESEKALVTTDMQVFFSFLLAFLILTFVAIFAVHLFWHVYPQRRFAAFLSHHKAGCAVGARLMKFELTQRCKASVFLDSDELDNLENVLDIVRSMSKTFVILHTAEILWRPWCAGEISMAYLCKIPSILVAYDDYVEPTNEELTLEGLSSKWTHEAWAAVSVQGVTLQHVLDAYFLIRDARKIKMERLGCSMLTGQEHGNAMSQVAAGVMGKASYASPAAPAVPVANNQELLRAEVVVLGDNADGEAVSTVQVLTKMIREQMQTDVMELFDARDVGALMHPKCVVASWTPGALTSVSFAFPLIKARRSWNQAPVVTVQAPTFVFPTKASLEKSIYSQISTMTGSNMQTVREVYGPLLSVLALPFGPCGNLFVMTAEASMLVTRLRGKTKDAPDYKLQEAHGDDLTQQPADPPHTASLETTREVFLYTV